MATLAPPKLTVRFEAQGRDTTRLLRYKLESSYLTVTDGFEFALYERDRANLRGLEMEPVELLLSSSRTAGASQVTGRIDITEGDHGALVCQGRDYLADAVECRVDPSFKVRKDMTLGDAIQEIMSPVGINKVIADGDLALRNLRTGKSPSGGAGKDFRRVKLDELKPDPGQGIIEFSNRQAARNGATVQPSNVRSEVYLSAPDYDQAALYQIRRSSDKLKGQTNNVKTAKARRDFSSFPTYTLFTGKKAGGGARAKPIKHERSTLALAKEIGGELYEILSRAIVPDRRKPALGWRAPDGKLYRLLYQKDEDARNAEQIECVARRAMGELLKETLVYRATLKGHEDPESGALWGVNTIVDVVDEVENVNEQLWIASRTFSYSRDQGATTEIECWRKGALQL